MAFANSKDEMIAFTRHRNPYLRTKLTDARIIVKGHTLVFNTEVTRWLAVYLDTGLQFWAQKNRSLEKAKKAEDRVCRLKSTNGLEPDLVQRIQVTAVQAVALYDARLWWQGQKRWCNDF